MAEAVGYQYSINFFKDTVFPTVFFKIFSIDQYQFNILTMIITTVVK